MHNVDHMKVKIKHGLGLLGYQSRI